MQQKTSTSTAKHLRDKILGELLTMSTHKRVFYGAINIHQILQNKNPVHLVNSCKLQAIVSQLSKCLKCTTFREGCFKTRSWTQVLK